MKSDPSSPRFAPEIRLPAAGEGGALAQAVALHRAGRLIDAERVYKQILEALPKQPDALHNMGVLQMQCTNPAAAVPWFHAALEAQPENPQCWLSYAEALLEAGEAADARMVLDAGREAGLRGEEVDMLELRVISAVMSDGLLT